VDDEEALAESRRALGANLVAQQKYAEALPLLAQALAVLGPLAPPSDEQIVSVAFNLSRALYAGGDPEQALSVLAPSAQSLSDPSHDTSVWAALVAFDHGFLLRELGRAEEAARSFGRACDLWRAHGGISAAPGEACLSQAEILRDLGRDAEAEPLLAFALDAPDLTTARRSHAAEHLITTRALLHGENAADEPALRRALDLSVEAWGDHTATAFAANRLGLALRDQLSRPEEALIEFRRARAIYAAEQGPGGQGAIATSANVVFTLNALERYDEALAEGDAILAVAAQGENATDSQRRAWRSFNLSRADALKGAGRYGEARLLLAARLAELEAEGADAAQMADVHTRIAQGASLQRDWPAMAEHRRRVVEHRRALGDAHAFGMAMAVYGQVLSQTGEDQAAYATLTEALRVLDGAEDTTDQDRLYVLVYLGYAAVQLGRLGEGERHLETAIAAYRSAGQGQGSLNNALRYLASLRMEQNRFQDAEALYLESLALAEAANDEEAASFAHSALGELWRYMGRLDEAETALRRAVDFTTQRYGADSVQNAVPLRNLAIHLDSTGRQDRALDLLLQVLALEQAALPPDDAQLLRTRVHMGRVLSDLGRYADAEAVFTETLAMALAGLGETSVVTQEAASQLGFVMALQGRYDEASPRLQAAAVMTERSFGPESRQMINVLQLWSYALYMERRFEEAIVILTRAVRLAELEGARWPKTVVDVRSNLGRTYLEAGRPAEALPPLRQAAALAARISRERARAISTQAEISRAPFRTLVDAAWGASRR
jgi:tetratricopeptide (TPR) repeat protein